MTHSTLSATRIESFSKNIDVTSCSNEDVLRTGTIPARAVCGVHSALDLYTHLKSLEVHAEEVEEEQDEKEQEDWNHHPFSYLCRLLYAISPLLLSDPALTPRKSALFQAAAYGTVPEVTMLVSLSFDVGDKESDKNESDEGDIRTYDVNDEDSEGNAPLLLTCRSGNLDIPEILVCADKLAFAEMLISKCANVEAVRMDGAGLLSGRPD